MSDDLINQLTLNCLISKHQLEKLNKKIKESTENNRKTDTEIYGQRITQLFNDLLVNEPPTRLLQEVKIGFDFFIDKCIYYFKAVDNNELLEKERVDDDDSTSNIIQDDIDYEREEREIEKGNYEEHTGSNDDDNDDDNNNDNDNDNDDDDNNDNDNDNDDNNDNELVQNDIKPPVIVRNKYYKKTNLIKVDKDWFQNVRENYKKNQIIPRKKI
jgi:hypothetical protein